MRKPTKTEINSKSRRKKQIQEKGITVDKNAKDLIMRITWFEDDLKMLFRDLHLRGIVKCKEDIRFGEVRFAWTYQFYIYESIGELKKRYSSDKVNIKREERKIKEEGFTFTQPINFGGAIGVLEKIYDLQDHPIIGVKIINKAVYDLYKGQLWKAEPGVMELLVEYYDILYREYVDKLKTKDEEPKTTAKKTTTRKRTTTTKAKTATKAKEDEEETKSKLNLSWDEEPEEDEKDTAEETKPKTKSSLSWD